MKEKLIHLLVPKENKIWCRQNQPIGDCSITMYPSKATCANCLTSMRRKVSGKKSQFRVAHTSRKQESALWRDGQLERFGVEGEMI